MFSVTPIASATGSAASGHTKQIGELRIERYPVLHFLITDRTRCLPAFDTAINGIDGLAKVRTIDHR